jgi:hypothetical protein
MIRLAPPRPASAAPLGVRLERIGEDSTRGTVLLVRRVFPSRWRPAAKAAARSISSGQVGLVTAAVVADRG